MPRAVVVFSSSPALSTSVLYECPPRRYQGTVLRLFISCTPVEIKDKPLCALGPASDEDSFPVSSLSVLSGSVKFAGKAKFSI